MRDAVTWVMLLIACAVVGILGYRYYRATEQIALLSEKTTQLTKELEGTSEVHKLAEAKGAKDVRKAEGQIAQLTKNRDQLKAEIADVQKALAKTRQERDGLKAEVATARGEVQKLANQLQAVRAEKEERDRRVAELEKEVGLLQQTVRSREAKLQEMEKTHQADQEALRTWQSTGQRLIDEQKKLRAELQAREEELKRTTLLQAERAAEVHGLTEALKDREERIAALKKRLQELGVR